VERQIRSERIHRVLGDRCDVIGRQLGRAGLRAMRLDDLGLAQLYHTNWSPEVARAQRLRRELADYTALVVGADLGGRPPEQSQRRLEDERQGRLRSREGKQRC
jgi:hypothetical protein